MTMANYLSSTKTNDFRVTDLEKFCDLMNRCCSEDKLEIWQTPQEDGSIKVGFGVSGTFDGIMDDEDDDYDKAMNRFVAKLQPLIHPDDACILVNVGWEKLRYVGGNALVITGKGTCNVNLHYQSIRKAGELLGNPDYDTDF